LDTQLTGWPGSRHRYRYGYVVAVFLLLLAPVLSPIAAPAPRPAVAQPMVAIAGMGAARALSGHVRVLGPVPSDQPMQLAIGLAMRHGDLLDGFLRARSRPGSPLYHHNLTPDDFAALFAPTASAQDALAAYLQQYGLRVTRTYRDRLLLDVAGTAAQVSAAFGVSLARYRGPDSGILYYANLTAPRLPADLAPLVTTVVGLRNDMARAHGPRPHLSIGDGVRRGPAAPPRMRVPAPPSGLLTPAQVQDAFDVTPIYSQTFTGTTGLSVTAPITGAGQTVALYELSPYNPSDIAAYDAAFGISATPPISVPVDGGAVDAFSGAGAAEAAYDIEMVQAIAPGARIIVYSGPASPSGASSVGADDAYARAVNDDRAQVLSTSWGQCEQAQQNDQPPDLTLLHNLFAQAVAEGMTVVAASGDNGSHDCLNGDGSTDTSQQAVDYPASDPYVIAVGGTTLTPGSGGNVEKGWAESGGGSSIVFPRPPWQTGPGLPTVSDASARLVPDVALNAGTPYAVWVNNSWYPVKGTSAGAPVWAALLALTNQARYVAATANGAPAPSSCAVLAGLGDIHGALYTLGSTPAFNDVTDGPSNGIAVPGPGWDYVTGLGVPDAYLLLRALVAAPALAPPNPGSCPSPPVSTPTPQATTTMTAQVTATATASPVASVTPSITGAPTSVRPTPSPTGSTTPPSSIARGRVQLVVSVTPRRVRPGGLILLEVHGAGGPGRSIVVELRYPHGRSQEVKGTTNAVGAAVIRVRVPRSLPSRRDISVSLRVTVRLHGRVVTGTTNFHVVSS